VPRVQFEEYSRTDFYERNQNIDDDERITVTDGPYTRRFVIGTRGYINRQERRMYVDPQGAWIVMPGIDGNRWMLP
jgi:hypothetical protein